MDRFEHSEARLSSSESFLIRERSVKLYDGDEKVSFRIKSMLDDNRHFGVVNLGWRQQVPLDY
jgi:hypothetical protein